MSSLNLLWDESQLWGLLAWNALKSMDIPFKVIRSSEISDGILQKNTPKILLVPGGSARSKAESLSKNGMEAIRSYVHNGGHYLGFCGGAGLGLSTDGTKNKTNESLALCPWTRASYDDRMQHFMSGHLLVDLPEGKIDKLVPAEYYKNRNSEKITSHALPVWWPGNFLESQNGNVIVLARYGSPAEDFWLADLPVSSLPADAFSTWHDLYGLGISPNFLQGQPCMVHGEHGKGTYTLSYSHLETPLSPFANRWFGHLLQELGNIKTKTDIVSDWDLGFDNPVTPVWQDTILIEAQTAIHKVIDTGLAHGLLFKRTPWLLGWRPGIPGSALGGMHAAICHIISRPAHKLSGTYWEDRQKNFKRNMDLFVEAANNHLLAERLALTLSRNLPGTVSPELLKVQRHNLFGPPMQPGGLYHELIQVLDELAFLQSYTS